jgi:flagellar basal-body rod protein FlgC
MNFIRSLNISATGLYAQKRKMDIIAQNIANSETTVTETGSPYIKKMAIMSETVAMEGFDEILDRHSSAMDGAGVAVEVIDMKDRPFKLIFDPDHPQANGDGYVEMPNIDTTEEMIDMLSATRAYEANLTVMDASKSMFAKAIDLLK